MGVGVPSSTQPTRRAIAGEAAIIVSGDDLRADDELRAAMETYGIQLLGVDSFLKLLDEESV